MKKGLSPIVSAILILLIAISVTLLAIIWLPRFISNIFPPEETELNNSYIMSRSCLSIDNIDSINNILTLKNCGKTSLQGFTFYIDGQKTSLQLDKLDPQESADIEYGHIIKGNHNFYITADYAETSIINFYEIGACDFYIYQSNMTNTYPISQSNKVYCLAENISIIGQTAIFFNPGVQNSILDCQNYNIRGSDASGTHGIYMTGSFTKNNMITDCTVTYFYDGLYVEYSTNNLFSDNTFNINYYGIRFFGAGNNRLNNIIVDSNNNGLEIDSGDYNIFEGITANSNVEGLYFGSSNLNTLADITADYNSYGLNINATSINNAFSDVNANYNDIYGFFLNGTSGNNLNYINASYDSYGLYLLQASNNNIINSEASYNAVYGFIIQANSNVLINNVANQNNDTGILLNGSYNTLTGNNVNGNGYGINVILGSNNITGGSVINNTNNALESNPADYAVNHTSTSNFTDTNFTDARKIFFFDTNSWFNYRNTTDNKIWLKTNVSSQATVTRKLVNWNQTLMKWNDTPSTAVTERYNITGLLPNQQYNVYNTSAGVQTNPYTPTTDGNGTLNFTIKLNGNTEILVNVSSIVGSTAPQYFFNSTNSTSAGTPIMHSLYWNVTNGDSLSGYIFQFCNGTWTGSSCLGSSSNWLSGWQYRKQHNIINAAGAGVNYTININVINGIGTDSGNTVYINNKARSDFGDIRFTNSTGSLLNYWMESVNNGVNATFWVQIDGNLTSTNQSIYIYYGNSTMTNLSNGNKTFNLFDDFLGSSLDTSKWQMYSIGNSYGVSSSQLVLSYTTSYTWLRVQSISAFDVNYAFRMRFHISDVSDYNKLIYLQWMDYTTGEGESGITYFGFYKNDYHDRFWRAYDGTATESYDMGAADTNWHIADVDRASDSLAKCYYDNNFEKDFTTSVTGGNKIIGMKIGSSCCMNYGNYNVSIDWVAIRKYVYPEPSHGSWGSEEAQTSGGGWWNETNFANFDGLTSAWSNVIKVVNSTVNAKIAWCVYANDTFNHWNGTSCLNPFVYVVTGGVSPFQIDFVNPTPSDGNVTSNNFTYVNVSIVNSLNTSSFIDWNRSLVGYWAMDWYNSSGVFDNSTWNNFGTFNGLAFNDGTIYGATRVSGKYGKALQFDGVSNYVDTGKNFSALGLGNNFSVFMWAEPMLVDNNWHTTIGDWIGNTGHFSLGLWNNNSWAAATNISNVYTVVYGPQPTTGNWYYIGFTLSLNGEFAIWVNGNKVGNATIGSTFTTTTAQTVKIGDRGDGITRYNGIIDEVRIYNRSLSQAEIQADMQSSVPINRTVASYSFEEPSGATYVKDTHILVQGKYGSALNFNGNDYAGGSNESVIVPDSPSLNISGTSFTLSAWIYLNDYSKNIWGSGNLATPILNRATNGGGSIHGQGYGLGICDYCAGHPLRLNLGWGNDIDSNLNIGLNQWYFVAVSYSNNGSSVFFNANGLTNSSTNQLGYGPVNYNLEIGYNDWAYGGLYLNGKIDEVRIWNRALSPEEINASYNSSVYRLYHNFTNLTNGAYQYYAYAIDTAGNANKTLTRSFTSSPPSSSPPILWFKFNEANGTKTYDSSGNGFVGTFGGESFNNGISYSGSVPTNLHTSPGKYGNKALSFDGVNDFVNVSDSNSLDVGNITITAWIYPLSWAGGTNGNLGRIVDKGSYMFFIVNNSITKGQLSFYYTNSNGIDNQSWSSGNRIVLKAWQFVAVTYNGTHSTFYVNGTFNGTTAHPLAPGPIKNSTNSLYIGNRAGNDRQFNGTIDEVRIWNRSLSQAEIQAEMSSSLPTTEPAASWSFEEPSGATYVNDTHIWVNGTYGSALAFNGNDAVNVSNIHNSSLTVMAWIYPTQFGLDQRAIASVWGTQWLFRVYNDTTNGPERLQFSIENTSCPADCTLGYEDSYSSNVINLNQWSHVAVVYDSPGKTLTFYRNATPVGSNTYKGIMGYDASILRIGAQLGANDYFIGFIDEVKIWNRTLTQAEIQTAMNTP